MSIPDNLTDPDAFYSALVEIHDTLGDEESERFNLALIFILANHIGDAAALADYLRQALAAVNDDKEGGGKAAKDAAKDAGEGAGGGDSQGNP